MKARSPNDKTTARATFHDLRIILVPPLNWMNRLTGWGLMVSAHGRFQMLVTSMSTVIPMKNAAMGRVMKTE